MLVLLAALAGAYFLFSPSANSVAVPTVVGQPQAAALQTLSTAGLRKPVGEMYPSRPYLEMAVDAGVPIALSSDAHITDHLAFGYDQAVQLLQDVGVKELAVFEKRRRRMEPLG